MCLSCSLFRKCLSYCPCPKCAYANDETFSFCQQCGYARRSVSVAGTHESPHTPLKINEKAISERLDHLARQRNSTRYSKQKSALGKELATFLSSLSTPKSLASALPSDVISFLVWKDQGGKTRVHTPLCTRQRRESSCDCPKRLACGTVDALIGKLRAIFATYGRGSEWQPLLGVGNPAACRSVKNYLADIRSEQLQARVASRQAEPVLLTNLEVISRHIHQKLMKWSLLTPSQIFVLARDQAVFKALFFSSDRAADLLQLKTCDILRFPDNSGFLLNHVWTKTLRSGDRHVLALKRGSNIAVCPVTGLELYVQLCNSMAIDLSSSFVFRPLSRKGRVSSCSLDTAAAQSRLDAYCSELRHKLSSDRFTLHGFRSGSGGLENK